MGFFSKKSDGAIEEHGKFWAEIYVDLIEGTLVNTLLDETDRTDDEQVAFRDEISFLFIFLLERAMLDIYSKDQMDGILGEFISRVSISKNMDEIQNGIYSYFNAWNEAISREDDGSPLSQPSYMIAKNAAIRSSKTDSATTIADTTADIADIAMFSGIVGALSDQIVRFRDEFLV